MNERKLTEYLDSLLKAGLPSFDCMVSKDHELLYRHMGGFADAGKTEPIRADQKYLMFSMTKIQTMTAVMQLVEQGKLSLEDEVAKYLPAYRNLTVREKDADGKERIVPADKPLTMLHLVTMQSGLNYDLHRPGVDRFLAEHGGDGTTRELVDAMAESPLDFHPGTHFQYSLSHDVAAAVVEVVSGKRFSEYLAENVWTPLGMSSTCFCKGMNEGVEGLAQQYVCDNGDIAQIRPMEPSCDYQLAPGYESGGAGLMSTTEDYAKLADAIACGGVAADGTRILKPETVAEFSVNRISGVSQDELVNNMGRRGYGYGIGMQVLTDPALLGTKAPAGIFGWDGAAGSLAIMDPKNHMSLVFTMHVRNCGYAYGVIHPSLRDLMYED
ncbi:MAG: beta-lactamase family protein [Lachnospiraceae bacterium]|nr:beta-lactamase family protein [Lachnospiraceae bacterium]